MKGNGLTAPLYGGSIVLSRPCSGLHVKTSSPLTMSDRIACRAEQVVVREECRETLDDLIYKLFERRHHNYVAGREQDWLTVELVQSIRRESEVYREELSTKTSGPLPFALGYFQRHEDRLKLTSDEVPANVDPKTFVRFLSEFVEPGARLWFGTPPEQEGWIVQGVDAVEALEQKAASGSE